MLVIVAVAGADALAQAQPASPVPPRRAAAPSQARQQLTQTTTSGAGARAEARAGVSVQWIIDDPWFAFEQWPDEEQPGATPANAPLAQWMRQLQIGSSRPSTMPSIPPSAGPRPEARTWHDPREQPTPSGVIVGAFARAEAHADSRSRSTSTASPHGAATQQSGSTSRSRASAKAQAQIMISPGFQPGVGPDQPRVEALSPERQMRSEALSTLSRQSDWRAGLVRLGQTYLDHPELLAVDLTGDNPDLDGAQVRAMLTKANLAAARGQGAAEWVGVSVLLHADGRVDAARQTLSRIVAGSDAEQNLLDEYTRALDGQNRTRRWK